MDYLEVIGQGKPLTRPGAALHRASRPRPARAPKSRGTRSWAVPERGIKVSLRSPYLIPQVAIVDPELTLALPAPHSEHRPGRVDAADRGLRLLQANPLTDPICREGIQRAARSLLQACRRETTGGARGHAVSRACSAALALANAKLGARARLRRPIGGMFHAPHGVVCACLLGHVMAANIRALQSRTPQSEALRRYGEVARLLTGDPSASAEQGPVWVGRLTAALDVRGLGAYGLAPDRFEPIVRKRRRPAA